MEVPRASRRAQPADGRQHLVFAVVAMTACGLVHQFTPEPAAAAAPAAAQPAPRPRTGQQRGCRRRPEPPSRREAEENPGGAHGGIEGRTRGAAKGARNPEGRGGQGLHHRQLRRHRQVAREGFLENAPDEAGFAVILMSMFLLGVWFVRSGVMENTATHLPCSASWRWSACRWASGWACAAASSRSRTLRATATTAGASRADSSCWATCQPAWATSA